MKYDYASIAMRLPDTRAVTRSSTAPKWQQRADNYSYYTPATIFSPSVLSEENWVWEAPNPEFSRTALSVVYEVHEEDQAVDESSEEEQFIDESTKLYEDEVVTEDHEIGQLHKCHQPKIANTGTVQDDGDDIMKFLFEEPETTFSLYQTSILANGSNLPETNASNNELPEDAKESFEEPSEDKPTIEDCKMVHKTEAVTADHENAQFRQTSEATITNTVQDDSDDIMAFLFGENEIASAQDRADVSFDGSSLHETPETNASNIDESLENAINTVPEFEEEPCATETLNEHKEIVQVRQAREAKKADQADGDDIMSSIKFLFEEPETVVAQDQADIVDNNESNLHEKPSPETNAPDCDEIFEYIKYMFEPTKVGLVRKILAKVEKGLRVCFLKAKKTATAILNVVSVGVRRVFVASR